MIVQQSGFTNDSADLILVMLCNAGFTYYQLSKG